MVYPRGLHSFSRSLVTQVAYISGGWGRYIGQMAGVSVPLIAFRHAYIVTERIEGIQTLPNTRDHEASVYFKRQGDALCVGGYEKNPVIIEDVSHFNKAATCSYGVLGGGGEKYCFM